MLVSTRPEPSEAGMMWFLVSGDEECDPVKLNGLLENRQPPSPIVARRQIRLEAENFRHLDGFVLEDRKDKNASHQLNVRLGEGLRHGRICTKFDEPFARTPGRYDVLIRYLEEKELSCRYTLSSMAASGKPWVSPGDGRGWQRHTVPGVEIPTRAEIRVDAEGSLARLDYVQLNLLQPQD